MQASVYARLLDTLQWQREQDRSVVPCLVRYRTTFAYRLFAISKKKLPERLKFDAAAFSLPLA